MNLIYKTEGMTAKDMYTLTKSNSVKKLASLKGQTLEYTQCVLYEDMNPSTGEVSKVLALKTADGNYYATNSKTFIRGFEDILAMFAETNESIPTKLVVAVGTSRNNREYLSCEIAE